VDREKEERMVFRRRRSGEIDEPVDDLDGDLNEGDQAEESADAAALAAPASDATRPSGPWDAEDAPEDETPRIDLGAIHVPAPEGVELRVDMQDQVVVNATLVQGPNALQIQAFAAPKSAGIWLDVRDEIAKSLQESGGSAELGDGPFGPELRARVPPPPPNEGGPPPGTPPQPLRFIGVDGPRWFLRGLLTGPAATDPNQARRLLDIFRGTVVHRGGDAMAPRDLLPLRLPKEAMQHQPEPEPSRPGLEMFERGPEITEIQ
jgi:hypothetical protein